MADKDRSVNLDELEMAFALSDGVEDSPPRALTPSQREQLDAVRRRPLVRS